MLAKFLTPSVRISLGILAVFLLPFLVKIWVLVPVVETFFPDSVTAKTVRRVIHVSLTILTAVVAIPWMRLHRKEGLTAPITRVFIGALVILILPVVILNGFLTPLFGSLLPAGPLTNVFPHAIAAVVVLAGYALLFRYYEGRPVKELAPAHSARETGIGFGFGILIPSLVFGILAVGGVYSVTSVNHPSVLVPAFISMTWVAFWEELFFRGVLYRITEESWGTHLAIALSALIFGLAHFGNAEATILSTFSAALGGVLLGLAYSFSGRLWLPIGVHLGWNFIQIFFGSPVSGVTEYGGFLEGNLEGPDLLTGGAWGVETSLPLLVLLTAAVALVYWATVRRGKVSRPYWRTVKVSPILLGGSTV